MLNQQQEIALIKSAKLNISAFGPLYDAHFSSVFGFVFKRIRNKDITADLVSLTFMKAMNGLRNYKITGVPFSAWLIRIALNEVRQYHRNSGKNISVPLSETEVLAVSRELNYSHQKDLNQHRLVQALNKLNENAATYIELRFFEERSFSEMADILNISPDNAKVRTYRALKQLKTLIHGSDQLK